MESSDPRWKVAAEIPHLDGPHADINANYAAVWLTTDAYGRVHHVTTALEEAERRIENIRAHFIERLHAAKILFRDSDVYVDGLPGGINRMLVSFALGAYGGKWDDATQEAVTTALNGYGIRDYKALPRT